MDPSTYVETFDRRDWQSSDPGDGPVRLAMIGLGWWTVEQAIPAVADAALCETTVVVSSDPDKADRIADEVGTVEAGLTYEQFHDGAATDHYDAVYVCTPNAFHLPYVETAAEFGKAVVCEKPMEATVDRAERMVAAADEADVALMVAYRLHTDPAVRRLREAVADGVLGRPVQFHGHMSQHLLAVIPDPDQWRLDPDLAGPGTTVTDIGVYPLNTARFLLDADPVAVQATMATETTAEDSEHFEAVPDERASFSLRFPDDVVAQCSASQNAAQTDFLSLVGTEGEARLDPAFFNDRPRTLSLTRGDTTVETTVTGVDQMREEFDYFADCVLTGRTPTADGRHGLVDMRAIEAIYEAADRDETVTL